MEKSGYDLRYAPFFNPFIQELYIFLPHRSQILGGWVTLSFFELSILGRSISITFRSSSEPSSSSSKLIKKKKVEKKSNHKRELQ